MANAPATNGSTEKPRRSLQWRGQLPRSLSIIFVWRMIPMAILLLLTANPWGGSYMHWAISWGKFVWMKIPELTSDEQFRLGAFELNIIAIGMFASYVVYHWRETLKLTMGQFALYRLLPIAVFAAVGYLWTWSQVWVWKARLYDAGLWQMSRLEHISFAGFILVGLFTLAWWIYVARKSWHELGSNRFAVTLALAMLASVVYMLYELGLLPSDVKNVVGLVEILFGLGVGFTFSIALLDRNLSWTFGTSTVVTELDHEPSVHDHATDDDFHEVEPGQGPTH